MDELHITIGQYTQDPVTLDHGVDARGALSPMRLLALRPVAGDIPGDDTWDKIEAWRSEYNSFRPHHSLCDRPPENFEEQYCRENPKARRRTECC